MKISTIVLAGALLIITTILSGCYTSFTHPGSTGRYSDYSNEPGVNRDASCISCHVHRHPTPLFWHDYCYHTAYPWYRTFYGYPWWWWWYDEENGDEDPPPSLPSISGTSDREPFDWEKKEPPGQTGLDSAKQGQETPIHLKRPAKYKSKKHKIDNLPDKNPTKVKTHRPIRQPETDDEGDSDKKFRTQQESD